MENLMLDLETLGTSHDSAIVQVAGIYFDPDTSKTGETFCMSVRIESAMEFGKVDGKTLAWWFDQDPDVIKSVMRSSHSLQSVLIQFSWFAQKAKYIWSHATFDFVILNSTFRKVGIASLNYRSAMDIRTLMCMTKYEQSFPREGHHHNALADCIHQVKYVSAALQKLKQGMENGR